MGQWGSTYRVNGAEFLVHLNTGGPFDNITHNSLVDAFMKLSSSDNPDRDVQTEYNLTKAFVGKKVSQLDEWYKEYQDRDVRKPKSPWSI